MGQEAGPGAGRGVAVTSNSGLHYSSGGQHQLHSAQQLPQFPSPAGHQYLNNGHQVGHTSSEALILLRPKNKSLSFSPALNK